MNLGNQPNMTFKCWLLCEQDGGRPGGIDFCEHLPSLAILTNGSDFFRVKSHCYGHDKDAAMDSLFIMVNLFSRGKLYK